MSYRSIAFIATPTNAAEADGVEILRSIGSDRMVFLDPILLIDHLTLAASEGAEPIGFPRHPHRGIETLTYVFEGRVQHRDSLGNVSEVGPGGCQWMTAGNAIWHEEMLVPDGNGTEALQLWFSLPADQKRFPASYQAADAPSIPEVNTPGTVVRVVSGDYQGVTGPMSGIAVHPLYLDIQMSAGATLEIPTPTDSLAVLYVVRGAIQVGDQTAEAKHLVVLTPGDSLRVSSESGARAAFVCAKPLGEPVVQYRSFVMNQVDEIGETLSAIENGTFAADHPGFRNR